MAPFSPRHRRFHMAFGVPLSLRDTRTFREPKGGPLQSVEIDGNTLLLLFYHIFLLAIEAPGLRLYVRWVALLNDGNPRPIRILVHGKYTSISDSRVPSR